MPPDTAPTPSPRRRPGHGLPDAGDMDWTLPVEVPSPPAQREQEALVARCVRASMLHGATVALLTALLVGWWIASGHPPAADPRAGSAMLLLHAGAFTTAWLAVRSAYELWLGLDENASAACRRKASLTQGVAFAAGTASLLHVAMVIGSMLQ